MCASPNQPFGFPLAPRQLFYPGATVVVSEPYQPRPSLCVELVKLVDRAFCADLTVPAQLWSCHDSGHLKQPRGGLPLGKPISKATTLLRQPQGCLPKGKSSKVPSSRTHLLVQTKPLLVPFIFSSSLLCFFSAAVASPWCWWTSHGAIYEEGRRCCRTEPSRS